MDSLDKQTKNIEGHVFVCCCRKVIDCQLCCMNWLLEALTLDRSCRVSPLTDCWDQKYVILRLKVLATHIQLPSGQLKNYVNKKLPF